MNASTESSFPAPLSHDGKTVVGAVLVVGGGIAGMQASLDLADAGFKVYLVEKEPAIGGHMAALDKTFPTNDCAMCTISPRLVTTASHRNIEVLTNTELLKLDGDAGHFTATVRRNPRYIDVTKCTACGDCAPVCPIVITDQFNGGLSDRKAAYKLYPQAVPNAYALEKKGIAPCRDTCPAGQRAQGYIALIHEGRYADALRVIKEDNPFPGICGRICNHLCETECNRNLVDEPISIAALKRFVTDQIYAEPYVPPQPASRKFVERVAVIGAGPCGLTAAKDLIQAGYEVTVFEALPVAGGMLRVGVPEYRLPAWIVNREVQEIVDLGVELRLNQRCGVDFTVDSLLADGYGAVFLGVGLQKGMPSPMPGDDLEGTMQAVDFLREVSLGHPPAIGERVVVIGGGDVAFDAARSALRIKTPSGNFPEVTIAYRRTAAEMPATPEEIEQGIEEQLSVEYLVAPVEILGKDGKIVGIKLQRMQLGEPDERGRRRPVPIAGAFVEVPCDTVIVAIGQALVDDFAKDLESIAVEHDQVKVDPVTLATSCEGVFAGGDVAALGPLTAIEAIAAGHKAAASIHSYLRGENLEARDDADVPVVKLNPAETAVQIREGEIELRPRVRMAALEGSWRRQSFEEVNLGYTEQEARAEAARCLQCGVCSECLSCSYACAADAIDHDATARTEQLDVGAVVLASGFDLYNAQLTGEYGSGRFANVVTGQQYERILSPNGPYDGHLKRPSDRTEPKRIAWIQCVGSRRDDRNWCSAVCCMYATKQTLITQEHAPGTDCTVFYIDFRAHGKGFDAYYERAQEAGVRYVRAMPSMIKQDLATQDLEIRYALPDGQVITETFDMVVLSTGLQAPSDFASQADELGIDLTDGGFCRTTDSSPLNTTREGVFVCGPLAEPKDIPETVMSASAAAARAMTLLADARHTLVRPKEYPPEIDVAGQPPRIGVFVCHCGTNIAGVVDVEAVTEYARALPNVVVADHNLFTCSTDSQAKIRDAIKENNLNRVVVASCTPRTHESLFQNTIREAGLNFYLFELANIRDQCSWVHREYPEAATHKAKDLVRMAVAKVRLVEPLQRKSLEFNHDALVIGGGLAGMKAALELADQGFKVSLVERKAELGGNMRHLRFLLSHADPAGLLKELIERTVGHANIQTVLSAEISAFEGSLGKFTTTLRKAPDGSVSNHEARQVTDDSFQVTQPPEDPGEIVIQHGVVIVATGGQPYQPTELLYGQDERVVTQVEFEATIADRPDDIRQLKSVVMIQCVGSRTPERPYCSRLCCGQAVKNALEIKRVSPETEVYVLYRDIRTYGLLEPFYREAREAGVLFIRFEAERPPEVRANGSLQVVVHDALLNDDWRLDVDRLVLSVATVPQPDAAGLAQLLKVPLTQDGFFQEAHLKLRPVDFASDGIFLCGMAHYPKKAVTESVTQAIAAAGRAATVLANPVIEIEPTISHVVEEKCDGCAYCVDPCPFKAIQLVEYEDDSGQTKKRVVVDETACKGCGTCQATCPKGAIFVWHFKPEQLRAMMMTALGR